MSVTFNAVSHSRSNQLHYLDLRQYLNKPSGPEQYGLIEHTFYGAFLFSIGRQFQTAHDKYFADDKVDILKTYSTILREMADAFAIIGIDNHLSKSNNQVFNHLVVYLSHVEVCYTCNLDSPNLSRR